jgi:hypothetical protein
VTNWRRPQTGPRELAERAAALLTAQAAALGATGMVLVAPPAVEGDPRGGRYAELEGRLGLVGIAEDGRRLRGTWTEVALGPGFGACFVAREEADGWSFATSYDRELVVECALLIMALLPTVPPRRR